MKQGIDIQAFHATNDKQVHRDAFVAKIASIDAWKFASLIVEKAKVYPAIHKPALFYPQFLCSLLKFVFRGSIAEKADSLAIFTDTLPIASKKEAVNKSIKTVCRSELGRKPFELFHHCEESNVWLQVADYCTWAVQRKWELRDPRTYAQLVSHMQAAEFDALWRGTTRYY